MGCATSTSGFEHANNVEKHARVCALYEELRKAHFPDAEGISSQHVRELLENDAQVILVDCRTKTERSVSMLPGSVSQQEYIHTLTRIKGRITSATCVVMYDTIGLRAGVFAQSEAKRLADAQRDGRAVNAPARICNLEYGMLGWLHTGGRLVDARGEPTNVLHVYAPKWDLAPANTPTVFAGKSPMKRADSSKTLPDAPTPTVSPPSSPSISNLSYALHLPVYDTAHYTPADAPPDAPADVPADAAPAADI